MFLNSKNLLENFDTKPFGFNLHNHVINRICGISTRKLNFANKTSDDGHVRVPMTNGGFYFYFFCLFVCKVCKFNFLQFPNRYSVGSSSVIG